MTIASLFFSPKGRISRLQFWLGVLAVGITIGIAFGLASRAVNAWIAIPFAVFTMIVSYMLAIKRLHDRNKSGWWTLLFLWAPGALDRVSDKIPEDTAMWWLVSLAALALSVWALIELGFLRGTQGGNDYGADPLAKPENTVSTV